MRTLPKSGKIAYLLVVRPQGEKAMRRLMGICSAGVLTSAVLGGAGLSWPASLLAGLGASLFLLALVRPADVRKERMRDLRLEELTRSLELIWDPAQLQASCGLLYPHSR